MVHIVLTVALKYLQSIGPPPKSILILKLSKNVNLQKHMFFCKQHERLEKCPKTGKTNVFQFLKLASKMEVQTNLMFFSYFMHNFCLLFDPRQLRVPSSTSIVNIAKVGGALWSAYPTKYRTGKTRAQDMSKIGCYKFLLELCCEW